MAECELIKTCIFFNDQMANMPEMATLQKMKYCKGDNSICARFRVFKTVGREKVPKNLFPIDIKRAEQIISEGG